MFRSNLAAVLLTLPFLGAGMGCAGPRTPAPAIPPPAAFEAPAASLEADDVTPEPLRVGSSTPTEAAPESRCARSVPSESPSESSVGGTADFERVRATIEYVRETTGTPAVAVAVSRGNEIVWEEGFGWADKRRRIRATEHTMFSLASVSKPITATALMLLVQRGLLSLDDPINDHLSRSKVRAGAGDLARATLARVANHTAGLPLHYQFYYAGSGSLPPTPEVTRERYAVLVSRPGERYRYSNLGYGLLQHVITEVSGVPFEQFLKDQLFDPLGLKHTSTDIRTPQFRHRGAVRYDVSGKPLPDYRFDHDGASAIYSSAHDLLRFGMMHLGIELENTPPLLDEDARSRMTQLDPPADGYGLGWGLRNDREGRPTQSHNGGMPGVRTTLRLYPDHDVAIVVLANSEAIGGDHLRIADEIANALNLPPSFSDLCRLPEDHDLLSRWEGDVHTPAGPRTLWLELHPDGRATGGLGPIPLQLRGVTFTEGVLTAEAALDDLRDLGVEQAQPGSLLDTIRFDLTLRDGVLDGSVTALIPRVAATTFFASLARVPSDPMPPAAEASTLSSP